MDELIYYQKYLVALNVIIALLTLKSSLLNLK